MKYTCALLLLWNDIRAAGRIDMSQVLARSFFFFFRKKTKNRTQIEHIPSHTHVHVPKAIYKMKIGAVCFMSCFRFVQTWVSNR